VAESSICLKALTPEAKQALGGDIFRISHFPFKVGRESRLHDMPHGGDDFRQADSVPSNDLYLVEPGALLNVSRDHFLIEQREGSYYIVDRGSMCGTLVEGETVGERRVGGSRPLNDNDVIIVGTSESRFVFKFLVSADSRTDPA
jgi:hypothetical protein